MGWLSSLLSGSSVRDDGRINEEDIARAIDMAVEHTDPRLRMVSGYRRKLRKPVIRSLLYLNRMVERVPGPFEVSRKAYGADPQVNALFASVEAMRDVFSLSDAVREYLDARPESTSFFCSLSMFRQEKKVFGMGMVDGVLRKGIAQVAVNFSGHWIGAVGGDLDELRDRVVWRGMLSLSITALERLSALRTTTLELQQQQTLLKARLRQYQARGEGLDPPDSTGPHVDAEAIRPQLEDNERQLKEARASAGTLDGYLDQVCRILNHPSSHLGVKPNSVSVDRMGIRTDAGGGSGSEVVTAHITRTNKPAFDMILVRFPCSDLKGKEDYRKRARAYISALNAGR